MMKHNLRPSFSFSFVVLVMTIRGESCESLLHDSPRIVITKKMSPKFSEERFFWKLWRHLASAPDSRKVTHQGRIQALRAFGCFRNGVFRYLLAKTNVCFFQRAHEDQPHKLHCLLWHPEYFASKTNISKQRMALFQRQFTWTATG